MRYLVQSWNFSMQLANWPLNKNPFFPQRLLYLKRAFEICIARYPFYLVRQSLKVASLVRSLRGWSPNSPNFLKNRWFSYSATSGPKNMARKQNPRILSICFWKKEMGSLVAIEKLLERAYKGTFHKWREVCTHFLKTQMKFKSYLGTLHKNLKLEKGQLKKLKIISGSTIDSGLSYHTTFRQL